MKTKTPGPFLLGLVLFLAAPAIAAQSLGEFARQQLEKMKATKKATKVYTNDNLPARPPQEGATVASGIAATSASGATETESSPGTPQPAAGQPTPEAKPPETPLPTKAEKPEDKVKTRDYWQGSFKAVRAQLARAREEQQLVEDEIQLLQIQQAREIAPDIQAEVTQKIAARKDELETKRATTAKAQKALDDLQNEFKESGAPEEWGKEEQ